MTESVRDAPLVWDCVIVGAGVMGSAAAVYSRRCGFTRDSQQRGINQIAIFSSLIHCSPHAGSDSQPCSWSNTTSCTDTAAATARAESCAGHIPGMYTQSLWSQHTSSGSSCRKHAALTYSKLLGVSMSCAKIRKSMCCLKRRASGTTFRTMKFRRLNLNPNTACNLIPDTWASIRKIR
jgi:hypothetical protein